MKAGSTNRRLGRNSAALAALLALGSMAGISDQLGSPAIGEPALPALPEPPADGVMGFVIESMFPTVVPGKEACPDGTVPRLRDAYLETLPAEERARLKLRENRQEYERRWQGYAFGPEGTNICSQPELFDRPLIRTVRSQHGLGLDLDGDAAAGSTCAHESFTSPTGESGIDNQEYRAMGCTLEWRGVDGSGGDIIRATKQFFASGEWTQVLLLRGVNSLRNDSDVEVIYANTSDRPESDNKGNFLAGASFTINTAPPRSRNVLRGRIVNGVLTTQPQDIVLAQAMALGGAGTALVAGIDCAAYHTTLKKLADGMRDPGTGQCTSVSSAEQVSAVPAFINDVKAVQRTAAK